jgi:hypothetical protein
LFFCDEATTQQQAGQVLVVRHIRVGRQEPDPIQTRIIRGFLFLIGQVLVADERQEPDPFAEVT